MDVSELYSRYKDSMQKIADVKYAAAILQWDQETYLPSKGAAARARQLATLSETAHQLFTDENLGVLLQDLHASDQLSAAQQKNISLSWEDFTKQRKFTAAFVRKMSEAVSEAFYKWIEARKQNSFKVFQPALETLIALKKEEASLLGYTGHPYNALLNEFEKGASVAVLDRLFDDITAPLKEIIHAVRQQTVDDGFLHGYYPKEQQWQWGMFLVKALGFDLEAGRQDISEHPFTTNFSAKDVRITTRIDEKDFANMTWSCIHETGHALYEQGLADEEYGLPSGEYTSLSIHESQSRLWENCVGRSQPFWNHYLPVLKTYFPEQLNGVNIEQFVKAINKIQPSLIRTEADEASYHFHVKTRYMIEKELIDGSLPAAEIPERWSSLYKENLQVEVPDDKRGCLQDVHWSHGSFGYFPTYSLGSFYAAQFYAKAKQDIPDLEQSIASGNSEPLLQWLREKIHRHGKRYNSEELCLMVTGDKLNFNHFIEYLKQRHL